MVLIELWLGSYRVVIRRTVVLLMYVFYLRKSPVQYVNEFWKTVANHNLFNSVYLLL